MIRRRAYLPLLSLVAVAMASTGCSATGAYTGGGPLQWGPTGGTRICTPGINGTHQLFANHVPLEDGATVTIDSVTPVGASNMTVLSTSVMFLTGDLEMAVDDVPPAADFAEAWTARVPASGATFSSSDHVQLVAEVQAVPGEQASLEGLRVEYFTEFGILRRSVMTDVSLIVAATECSMESDESGT